MTPPTIRATWRRCAAPAIAGAVLALAACGGNGGGTSGSPASTPTPTPKGPPSAHFTLTGTGALNGAMSVTGIRCRFPSLNGGVITVDGSAAGTAQTAIRVTIGTGKVTVGADSGSGTAFTERDFSGQGVSGFDAASGASVSGSLTESTRAGLNPGSIGTISAVSGTVDCGNQQPGSSTLTFNGTTAGGAIGGSLSSAFVVCTGSTGRLAIGLTTEGGVPTLAEVYATSGSFYVYVSPSGASTTQSYAASGSTVASVTATGAHVNGDAVEEVPTGSSAHTLHVSGDVTCSS